MGDQERRAGYRGLLFALVGAAMAAGCGSHAAAKPAVDGTGCADPSMIDDLEDGDRFICASGARNGEWYTIEDGTSSNFSPKGDFTSTLIPEARGTSLRAARMTGFGFTGAGVAMGVHLNNDGVTPYDASAYQGVKFWMKSNVPLMVQFTRPETLTAGEGGTCVNGATFANCNNPFRFFVTMPATDDWVEYSLPFSTLQQVPGMTADAAGNSIPGSLTWDPSRLVGIQFFVNPGVTFDVWVDDLRFYTCTTPECLPTCTDPNLPVACPPSEEFPMGCREAGTDCAVDFPGRFFSVWGSGPTDVRAVGFRHAAGSPIAGAIEHWDGVKWSAVANDAADSLAAIWGAGPNDVWAVGARGGTQHWDGTKWSTVPTDTPHPLTDVWGSGTSDVWAVGSAGTLEHWDGAKWSNVPIGTTASMTAVWGTATDDVWAVGSTIIGATFEHWDGAAWSVVPSEAGGPYSGLRGSGRDDVWAVGYGIGHWNGAAWSYVPVKGLTDPTNQRLFGVRALAPNDVWAVGAGGTAVHWNGAAWSVVPTNTVRVLNDVWIGGPNDVWAVGYGFSGLIDHWDGATWSLVPIGTLP